MTASFDVTGQDVLFKFEYSTNVKRAVATVDAAVRELWDRGWGNHGTGEDEILFEDLTNQQKLNILDDYVLKSIRGLAKTHIQREKNVERNTSIALEIEEYIL